MLINETILEAPIASVTRQIGDLISRLHHDLKTRPEKVELGESFDVWDIKTENLRQAISQGDFPAYKTEFQLHQIHFDRRARAYALSRESTSGSPQVIKAAISPIAERIDEAIDCLDADNADESDDTEARLLILHSCRVYAFWLVDRRMVYLIQVPERFKRLRDQQYMNTEDFLIFIDKAIESLGSEQYTDDEINRRW
jgi:hypothetical protein